MRKRREPRRHDTRPALHIRWARDLQMRTNRVLRASQGFGDELSRSHAIVHRLCANVAERALIR